MLRGVRGAITIEENTESVIVEATKRMMDELISLNELEADKVASVFISVTEEIDAAFPAKALRLLDGWTYVPVMCMREIPVVGSLENCIRVMVHVNTDKNQEDIHHVYLEKAMVLRPDLNA
ncbi:chorismate mutase [Robertmurraya kyonggiensis]|uniref:chorismate mutase n=1 Tax=Robertmurraya kyonggiensis TaxID=1037680 RepID=A0A4U1DB47_9BACI|nr:chorismate mutase [Robertmurraya kyonggiensis]TKC19714.1 chorismate mutase [Robertmurraya kyonggiensis]